MFNNSDLDLLDSSRALEYLLSSDKLDFKKTLQQLKFQKKVFQLQVEMIKIQERVASKNKRVIILVEGREFAGKGGAIHVLTEHLNPRSIRTIALKAPTTREKSQWYFKRYIQEIPEGGEMVFFDRSWYNRALVEPVNGFCTKEEYKRFMLEVNNFERMLSQDGIILIKIYFSISKREQQRRIDNVRQNPLRRWELTPVDIKALELWDTYSKYEKKLFKETNTNENPWFIFKNDDKRLARLEAFNKILDILTYELK